MYRKLLLSGIILFSCIIIHDLSTLHKSKLPIPVFDFAKTNHPNKKKSATVSPFWETNKKSNIVDTAALKQSNWYADVVKNIEANEYEIKKDNKTGLYVAPNRQQQLSASFTCNSFTLQSRNEELDWILTMSLFGMYADKKLVAQPGHNDLPVISSNKIIFNNHNFSTEYINSKEGVRQNFIIQKEPASKPQTINIKLQTNKGWYINKVHDKELHFAKREADELSKKITYNSLKVWDANNKELVARFVVNKKHDAFEIEVNTADVVYPITIDPLSTTSAMVESNQINADMGYSVASAGDVNGDGYSDIIVGAEFFDNGQTDEGAAFVYHGSATGISATLAAMVESNQANSEFGAAVSSAGDVNGDGFSDVIVGSFYFDNGQTDEGAAFVYHGSATGISTIAAAMVESNQAGAKFGYSVASAGNVNGDGYSDIIVGAPQFSNGQSNEGAFFVYHGSVTGISTTAAAMVESNQTSAFYGISVASAGDVNGDGYSDVIVGAEDYDNGELDEGAAFIYHGSSTGIITTPAAMVETNQADARIRGVASAGDVNGDGYSDVIVGSPLYDNGEINEGAAFVYLGSATGISTTMSALIESNQISAQMGLSVASAGDVNGDGYSDIIVGVSLFDNGQSDEGAAFIYHGSQTGISTTSAAMVESNQANSYFGTSVASAGDVNGDGYSDIIVGAFLFDNGQSDEGAAFVYHGGPDGLKTTSNWQVLEAQGGANYGLSVASAGDVNSDGFSDVVVGAYIYDQGFTDNGKAFLYMGSATGLSTTASWTAVGIMGNEYFGRAVAAAGDVNGDGYGDVLVGAYGYTNGQSQEGRAYLYYGSAGGLAVSAAWNFENNVATSVLGASLAAAGDVNGDGYGDFIIGAQQYSGGQANEGKVYVFYGTSTIPAATANWSVESDQVGAFYGVSVASLGDVNGDGFSDVIVGAHTYDIVFADEGQAFAYYGSATGLSLTPNWTARGGQLNAQFGISVASAGDVNGDGYSDAIVGAYLYDNPTTDEGAVFVYYGSSTGLSATANWTAENNTASSFFGYSASSAGDVNGDGYSDVIVGAREISNGQSREGAMYAYYGSSSGLTASSSWYVESNVATSLLGNSVASAGDVNGDGYSEVIGGAPYYGGLKGAAFIYYGNNNTGLRHNLKLYNTDLSTPINRSNILVPNLFGAGLFTKSPLGRVKGKLVWEVKTQGQAFSGNPITNSTAWLGKGSYTDLGIAGIELKYNVQKLGRQNKIRVRVEYDKATAITGQVYGPWRYPPAYLQGAHGMNSIPLPVKLNWFNGELFADKVKLQWQSSDNENVTTYQIQRSNNNRNFISIGSVSSVHQNSHSYNFTDNQPLKGTSWYRLKITDEYNRINYSGTIVIKNTNDRVSIYPTIISKGERVNLQFKNSVTGTLDIQLVNSDGTFVFKKTCTINSNTLMVELPALSSGVYILSAIQDREKLITQKIIIR